MRSVIRTFIQGVVVTTPILLTVYVCARATIWLDSTIRTGLEGLELPAIPGLGVFVALAGIYLIGLLARTWAFKKTLQMGEWLVEKIPLVKSLYSSVRDLLQFLGGTEVENRGRPVRVHLLDGEVQMLGLITQDEPQSFLGDDARGRVAVYIPMSYQIGGYTIYVDQDKIEELSGVSVEELLKLTMTAGVGKSQQTLPTDQLSADEDDSSPPIASGENQL